MEDSLAYKLGGYAADIVTMLIIAGFFFAVIYALYYIIKGIRKK